MQNESPVATNPITRPSARPAAAMPIQRGNYGVPPRRVAPVTVVAPIATAPVQPQPTPVQQAASVVQPQPTPVQQSQTTPVAGVPRPAGPRMMDIAAPPRQVKPFAEQPEVQFSPAPVQSAAPTLRPFEQAAPAAPKKHSRILPKLQVALLIVGTLVLIGGAVRYATAGTTAGHIIAVGAVSANDGKTMTFQFTADDGKLHKASAPSKAELIPGSAVELAYRSGAPENSVKQVADVKANRSFGMTLILAGVALTAVAGTIVLVHYFKHREKAPQKSLATVEAIAA